MLGCSREIQLHRMPLARAHPSYPARVGLELFQYLLQPEEGAHVAAIFGPGQFETLRFPELDDHRQAGMVHRVSPVRHQALPADHPGHGKATASRRRAAVSSRVSGQSIEEPRLMRATLERDKGGTILKESFRRHPRMLHRIYGKAITPKVPARLPLGPDVKNNWFFPPLLPVPSPKSIPQSWSIAIALPVVSLSLPTNLPVVPSKALMKPVLVLFEISSVLLNGPNAPGAAAIPQAWLSGSPSIKCFPGVTGVPASVNTSMKPPLPPLTLAKVT